MKRIALSALLLTVAFAAQSVWAEDALSLVHFQLNKSAPEAEATVPSPSEIRLWFSQEPQEGTTSIRVVDAEGEALHTGDVTQDEDDPMVFGVALHGTLANGSYTVAWRAIGQDGHVVRGDFPFTVQAP